MNNLIEAKRHIDSFSRPMGYNTYAWNVTKKTALEVWRCHFNNEPYYRPLNFLCNEFYEMIKTSTNDSLARGKSIEAA